MRPTDLSRPKDVGISISESPDMRYFGFTDGHLKDAMAGSAINLLASGGPQLNHSRSNLLVQHVVRGDRQ